MLNQVYGMRVSRMFSTFYETEQSDKERRLRQPFVTTDGSDINTIYMIRFCLSLGSYTLTCYII